MAVALSVSAKFGEHWNNPLQHVGRLLIIALLMNPFERQRGDVFRQYAEHKTWVLTPMVGIAA
jgi:arylsulfatase